MGNSGSSVCCMSPDEMFSNAKQKTDNRKDRQRQLSIEKERLKEEITLNCLDNGTSKQTMKVDDKFSFSSISSKSSGDTAQHLDSIAPIDMRDESQAYASLSDELRVAGSSYDEAATEAVNSYYGNSSSTRNANPFLHYNDRDNNDGQQQRDQ